MDDQTTIDQRVFDTVVRHLRDQNEQCVNGSGVCKYHDPIKDNKCAISCLLDHSDSRAIAAIEDMPGHTGAVRRLFKPEFEGASKGLIRALQLLHDGSLYKQGYTRATYDALECIARASGLTPSLVSVPEVQE